MRLVGRSVERMATPDFILRLREKIGTDPLWLAGCTAVVLRPAAPLPTREAEVLPSNPADEVADAHASREQRVAVSPASGLEVLLVRRSDNGWWTPITGVTDPGEHPATTAVRESLEEARVTVEVERLVQVSVMQEITYANGDRAQYLDLAFRCRWLSGEAAVGDDESTEVRWFLVDELPDMREHLAARIRCAVANRPECELLVDGRPLPLMLP